jgi:glycosyltransferase involved in cell wall biosynthesis
MSVNIDEARRPLLSVVVPTRDRSRLLRQALLSVRRIAEDGVDLEAIVVDTSVGEQVQRGLTDELGARLIRGAGAGASAARNMGMAAATGEYLLFLDDDDVLLPAHVHRHVELLAARPELGAVFGQVCLADFELAEVGAPFPPPGEIAGDVFGHLLERMQQIASFVVRTSVRDTVGLFDEALGSSEDWDWELRLALRHEVAFVPVPCVLFRQRPMGSDDRLNRWRLGFLRRVFWRNVRRAGGRRPSAVRLLRILARHHGAFAGHFLSSWRTHVVAGDQRSARLALRGAVLTSLPHVLAWVGRDPRLLGPIARSYLPGGRPATALPGGRSSPD